MADNIIITGANQGIGYYMVEKLLAEGNKVSRNGRRLCN